jgi:hypothetical protein
MFKRQINVGPSSGTRSSDPCCPHPSVSHRAPYRGREACMQTCDPTAFEGLGNNCCWLVLGLAKGLAQLLHAVSVHDDGMPAGDRDGTG